MFEIIIPNYNSSEFIPDLIKCLEWQTTREFSVLICDDGSTDGSVAQLEAFVALTDLSVRLIKNSENRGLIYTLNRLVSEAKGEILIRLDPDDSMSPDRISTIVNDYRKVGFDIWFSDYQLVDKSLCNIRNKHFFQPSTLDGLRYVSFFNSPIPHATVAYSRKLFEHCTYDQGYVAAEDYRLWTVLLRDEVRVHFAPRRLYFYRIHGANETTVKHDIQIRSHEACARDVLKNHLKIEHSDNFFHFYFGRRRDSIAQCNALSDVESIHRRFRIENELDGKTQYEIECYNSDLILYLFRKNLSIFFLRPIYSAGLAVKHLKMKRLVFWLQNYSSL